MRCRNSAAVVPAFYDFVVGVKGRGNYFCKCFGWRCRLLVILGVPCETESGSAGKQLGKG